MQTTYSPQLREPFGCLRGRVPNLAFVQQGTESSTASSVLDVPVAP